MNPSERNIDATQPSSGPLILLLGPERTAVSGVSTHLNLLFDSELASEFRLKHFQVGSEGRSENALSRFRRLLSGPFQLASALFAEKPAIIHLNTSLNRRAFWRDVFFLLVARLRGVRVLYQIHGGELPAPFAANNHLPAAVLRLLLRLPDTIVVLARSEREAYQKFVPGQHIRLIPNAIDCHPYLNFPAKQANKSSPLQLLYMGRLARDKGIFDVLQGLKLARSSGAAAYLTVAGSGPDEAALRKRVEDLALTAAVSFVGTVHGDAKLKCFEAADVLLLPSYGEGMPYALLEAMAAGLPAITTRVGAIPDVVLDGVHGQFVAPGDVHAIGRAITRLASNRYYLAQMSAACRKRIAENYAMPCMTREFRQLYSGFDVPAVALENASCSLSRE